MQKESWDIFGEALLDYWNGDPEVKIRQHYADGDFVDLPVEIFFREYEEWPQLEQFAIYNCRGKVLEIGAGTGEHSLILQLNGIDVTSIDIAQGAVKIMDERGIKNTWKGNVFDFRGGKFDTLLMLMNGIGFVGTLENLDNFLEFAKTLIEPEGQLMLDSSDLEGNDLETVFGENYYGETTLQLEYKGHKSEVIRWLYVDRNTLIEHAKKAGWNAEVIYEGEESRYLAQLTLVN